MEIFNSEQLAGFNRDGYLIVRGLFTEEEIGLLGETARNDHAMDQASSTMDDGKGNDVRLSLWNHPGDGVYGMVARCRRVVDGVEDILGDEVYHYHSKMMLKDAKGGGAWAWHQDYGYWYQNGLLFPERVSVMIAVDPATRENGCMQVLRGSHRMGRVNHALSGEQAGADTEQVEEACKRLETVHCEMSARDALFCHSNTLHCSAANNSDHSRWALICCYNTRSNDPFKESHHPGYTPLSKVDDDMVLKVGRDDARRSSVAFANLVEEDQSAKSLASEGA
ncbi:MAG: phytanoyl-CoA dioxygenase family protein [Roseibacillus sp.]|nr:phytanoyl-CoA dioxygenase family protein [Roseibacillus sp.]